jgi:hypothetical protein
MHFQHRGFSIECTTTRVVPKLIGEATRLLNEATVQRLQREGAL